MIIKTNNRKNISIVLYFEARDCSHKGMSKEHIMGKKLVFAFSGTGDNAENFRELHEEKLVDFHDDVIRVYFNGCQDSAVGGRLITGTIDPDLDVVASGIRQCFNQKGELSLSQLKKKFGNAIHVVGADDSNENIQVDEIHMTGFSRGAVTTFATARFLDDLNIPMHLFANNPVPGNSKTQAAKRNSEYYKNHDLRGLQNLKSAEIALGVYKKNVNPIHNKFYRQMTPVFNDNCKNFMYVLPQEVHAQLDVLNRYENIRFFENMKIADHKENYNLNRRYSLDFVPKHLQQKFHTGIDKHIPLAMTYKNLLYDQVIKLYPSVKKEDSIKIGQALYALGTKYDLIIEEELVPKIMYDSTDEGKALREFIVEFNSINQYVFHKTYNNEILEHVDVFKNEVYKMLIEYPGKDATYCQKQAFEATIFQQIALLKDKIPKKNHTELTKLMSEFLKDNIITHQNLTKYIQETENYDSMINKSNNQIKSIDDVKNSAELAEALYFMSERSRAAAYNKISKILPILVNDANELGDIICFFTPKNIQLTLKNKQIMATISDLGAVNRVMEKLFTNEQRNKMFNYVQSNIKSITTTFDQLGELMQYLTPEQNKSLLDSISFENIKPNTDLDMIKLFERLSTEQLNVLMPQLGKKLTAHFSKNGISGEDQTLSRYIQSKITDEAAAKILNKIFPDKDGNKSIQNKIKTELLELISESRDRKEHVTLKKPT
jgi:hypothetical protein